MFIWFTLVLFGWLQSVHLVELKGTGELYAMKAMEKTMMLNRNKVYDGEWIPFWKGKPENWNLYYISHWQRSVIQAHRACIEREIISLLDHPFLPTLYASFQVYVFIFYLYLFSSCVWFLKRSFLCADIYACLFDYGLLPRWRVVCTAW